MDRSRRTPGARLLGAVAVPALVVLAAAGCHAGSAAPGPADQAYLSELHGGAPDIGSVRSDTQLVRLGHAVCDDFRARASYQEVADRLAITAGSDRLPSADLGAVITAAADHYCPQYRSLVS